MNKHLVFALEGILIPPLTQVAAGVVPVNQLSDLVLESVVTWGQRELSDEQFLEQVAEHTSMEPQTIMSEIKAGIEVNVQTIEYIRELASGAEVSFASDVPSTIESELLRFTGSIGPTTRLEPPLHQKELDLDQQRLFIAWNSQLVYEWSDAGCDTLVFVDHYRLDRELRLRGIV